MTPGNIAFLGSGETSLAGGRIFESLARQISGQIRIAVLETPAGFELNSSQVAGKVADFLRTRLGNYHPIVDVVAARKKGGAFSPDDPHICAPLLHANIIFLGAGSPTYAIHQLRGTLAWELIRARQRMGATLVFASAATIAAGAFGLPVYEIYKVGMDVHHLPGLDLFADFGLSLSIVPHWNNAEGGTDLDTSRCFVGQQRFAEWLAGLPQNHTLLGLDEHTGVLMDFAKNECSVAGTSSVTVIRGAQTSLQPSGSTFPFSGLGSFSPPAPISKGISPQAWHMIEQAQEQEDTQSAPPAMVLALAEARQAARARKDWAASDEMRRQLGELGWSVQDTAQGFTLKHT